MLYPLSYEGGTGRERGREPRADAVGNAARCYAADLAVWRTFGGLTSRATPAQRLNLRPCDTET